METCAGKRSLTLAKNEGGRERRAGGKERLISNGTNDSDRERGGREIRHKSINFIVYLSRV